MPAVRLTSALRLMWKVHRAVLRASGGRVGRRVGALPVLLLETMGRTTGRPRRVGLSHLVEDGRYYVVGSYAGEDRDPAWALNLRARPAATVTVGGRTFSVDARLLEGEERERIFDRFARVEPAYGEYRRRTARTIPVFELRPVP